MAQFRIPGPLGQWPLDRPVDEGTLWLGASPLPGPVQGAAGGLFDIRAPGLPAPAAALPPRRQRSGPPAIPLLKPGSQGPEVERLQRLLNLRLAPCPQLRVDGRFGPATQAAVQAVQQAAGLRADGMAGKDTWRVLGTGTVWQVASAAAAAPRQAAAAPGMAKPAAPARAAPLVSAKATAAGAGATADAHDVLAWSADKKFLAVARRAVDRLPGQTRDELLKMISPMSIGITLGVWAASHLVGAGEVVDVLGFLAGAVFLGWAVFDVAHDLGHALTLTHNAATEAELEEAAGLLAHVIVTIGVAALVALLSKVKLGRGGAAAGESAAGEAAAAESSAAGRAGKAGGKPGKAGAAETTSSKAAAEEATATKTSNKPADKAGSQCETAGCPISMVSGEEMLALDDFVWDGPLPITWRRFYRSGMAAQAWQLGHGWLTPLDEWLEVGGQDEPMAVFHNADGQRIELPLPAPGGVAINLPEQLRLYRDAGSWRLVPAHGPERVFAGQRGRCPLERWQRPGGPAVRIQRDASGAAVGLLADGGRALLITRAQGRITSIGPARQQGGTLQPLGEPWVRYSFDDAGDLVAVHNRLGEGERYAWRHHLLQRRTLASGFAFHFEWAEVAGAMRCLRNWGDGGVYDTRFEWLPGGVSRATDSRGGVTEYQHNAQSQLLRKRSPEGRETRLRYDERNLLRSRSDAAGQTTRFEHDAEGRLVAVVDPLGQAWRLQYDADGKPAVLIDPLNKRWTRRFDAQGRLVEVREPTGAATRYGYNTQGLLASVTDATGRRRSLLWDAQARLVGETGFDGVRRRYQYDADERITAVSTHDRVAVRYEHDAAGRLLAAHEPGGRSTRLRYDAAGRVTHFTNGAGNTTEYRYDGGLSQPSARIDPLGQAMRYAYDSERNLVALVNAKGESHRLAYDRDELLVEETGFDGRVQRYEYDRAGQLVRHLQRGAGRDTEATEPSWQATRFERDPLGRLLAKLGHDGSSARYGYDAVGRLLSAATEHSRVEFQRDALGRVLREVQDGQAVTSTYDLLGRRIRLQTPDGLRLDSRFDDQGRLATLTLDGQVLTEHDYDGLGREVSRRQGALDSHFSHDPMGRLLEQRALRDGGQQVLGRRYAHDAAGRVSAIDDFRGGSSRYVYDPADRLLRVQGLAAEDFVHDPAGNLLGSATEGGRVEGNRLVMLGDRHFRYDAAGNRVEERRGSGGRLVSRFAYDADNRLVRADTPNGWAVFRYDALGRRIAKQTAVSETRFVHDGLNLLADVTTAGDGAGGSGGGDAGSRQRRTYLFEPGSFRPLAMVVDGPGAPRRICHYHLDHLGTPRELTDAQGRIVWSARYRAYGAVLKLEHDEVDNPLRFQGQYHDAETGLHYNLFRFYDPEAGRFVNQDPIGLAGGANVYQYVPNPVNWVDPWGLSGKPGDCSAAIWSSTKNKTSVENAYGHWKKHGAEFPEYQNSKQYVEGAHEFAANPPAGTLVKTIGNRTVMYDEASNTFLSKSIDGVPKTMFRPDPSEHGLLTNLDYFNAQ